MTLIEIKPNEIHEKAWPRIEAAAEPIGGDKVRIPATKLMAIMSSQLASERGNAAKKAKAAARKENITN